MEKRSLLWKLSLRDASRREISSTCQRANKSLHANQFSWERPHSWMNSAGSTIQSQQERWQVWPAHAHTKLFKKETTKREKHSELVQKRNALVVWKNCNTFLSFRENWICQTLSHSLLLAKQQDNDAGALTQSQQRQLEVIEEQERARPPSVACFVHKIS